MMEVDTGCLTSLKICSYKRQPVTVTVTGVEEACIAVTVLELRKMCLAGLEGWYDCTQHHISM